MGFWISPLGANIGGFPLKAGKSELVTTWLRGLGLRPWTCISLASSPALPVPSAPARRPPPPGLPPWPCSLLPSRHIPLHSSLAQSLFTSSLQQRPHLLPKLVSQSPSPCYLADPRLLGRLQMGFYHTCPGIPRATCTRAHNTHRMTERKLKFRNLDQGAACGDGSFPPPSERDWLNVSLSADGRQDIRASACQRNPFKSPRSRQLLNTALAEPLTQERNSKAALHGNGGSVDVDDASQFGGAVNRPPTQYRASSPSSALTL